MREILFKAKRLDNGEWVTGRTVVQFKDKGVLSVFMPAAYGNCECEYDSDTENVISFYGSLFYKVDPETVCQYTGMSDKNGAKIFENDIISIPNSKKQGLPGVVKYNNRAARFEVVRVGFRPIQMDYFEDGKTEFEVIGNIYDKE